MIDVYKMHSTEGIPIYDKPVPIELDPEVGDYEIFDEEYEMVDGWCEAMVVVNEVDEIVEAFFGWEIARTINVKMSFNNFLKLEQFVIWEKYQKLKSMDLGFLWIKMLNL